MTDHDINHEIAEALMKLGFDAKLAWQNSDDAICAMGHTAPDAATPFMRCSVEGCGHRFIVYPHNFTDARYLFPVLEAYCAEYPLEFTCEPYEGGAVWVAAMRPAKSGLIFDGDAPQLGKALRNAFHAALTGADR